MATKNVDFIDRWFSEHDDRRSNVAPLKIKATCLNLMKKDFFLLVENVCQDL